MFSNILKHKLIDKNLNMSDVARLTGSSRSNLSQKLKRDNFSTREMIEIAAALGCDLKIELVEKSDA